MFCNFLDRNSPYAHSTSEPPGSAMSFRGHVGDDGSTSRVGLDRYFESAQIPPVAVAHGSSQLDLNTWAQRVSLDDLVEDIADAARLCGVPPVLIAHGLGVSPLSRAC
jgi:hypothetical protein